MTAMRPLDVALMAVTIMSICSGQILFKLVAMRANESHSWFVSKVFILLLLALVVYGTATLIWIYVLQTVPLGFAYLFMSLSFVLVPLVAAAVFGEQLSSRFLLGAALVVVGLGVSAVG